MKARSCRIFSLTFIPFKSFSPHVWSSLSYKITKSMSSLKCAVIFAAFLFYERTNQQKSLFHQWTFGSSSSMWGIRLQIRSSKKTHFCQLILQQTLLFSRLWDSVVKTSGCSTFDLNISRFMFLTGCSCVQTEIITTNMESGVHPGAGMKASAWEYRSHSGRRLFVLWLFLMNFMLSGDQKLFQLSPFMLI